MLNTVELFYRDAEQVWGRGDLGAVDDQYAEDLVFHTPASRAGVLGRSAYRRAVAAWRTAFPDTQVIVVGEVADEGNLVVGRWLVTGTHTGYWHDVPPSGQRVEIEELAVFHFADGLVDEIWHLFDLQVTLARIRAGAGTAQPG